MCIRGGVSRIPVCALRHLNASVAPFRRPRTHSPSQPERRCCRSVRISSWNLSRRVRIKSKADQNCRLKHTLNSLPYPRLSKTQFIQELSRLPGNYNSGKPYQWMGPLAIVLSVLPIKSGATAKGGFVIYRDKHSIVWTSRSGTHMSCRVSQLCFLWFSPAPCSALLHRHN